MRANREAIFDLNENQITMKNILYFSLCLLIALLMGRKRLYAQDTIGIKNNKLLTQQLKPGLRQYLVYFQDVKQNKKLGFWLWTRHIGFKSQNGKKLFAITQRWFGADTNAYRQVYSLNQMADFAPVYHAESNALKTKAYNWYPDHITGADSITNNVAKAFNLKFDKPNINWNLDMETFEMLPLAANKTFVINFYDAGLAPPAYITLKVTGSEVISTFDNQKVDCWKLFNEGDHNKMHYTETYWISKSSHEFLKEEDNFNGNYRYKIKLPAFSADLLSRFK